MNQHGADAHHKALHPRHIYKASCHIKSLRSESQFAQGKAGRISLASKRAFKALDLQNRGKLTWKSLLELFLSFPPFCVFWRLFLDL